MKNNSVKGDEDHLIPSVLSILTLGVFCLLLSFFFNYFIVHFWLCWVFVAACGLFSGCGGQRLRPSCGVLDSHCGGSSVTEHRFQASRTSGVVANVFSWPSACGIFPDEGSTMSPALAGGFLTTGLPGIPSLYLFLIPRPNGKGVASSKAPVCGGACVSSHWRGLCMAQMCPSGSNSVPKIHVPPKLQNVKSDLCRHNKARI